MVNQLKWDKGLIVVSFRHATITHHCHLHSGSKYERSGLYPATSITPNKRQASRFRKGIDCYVLHASDFWNPSIPLRLYNSMAFQSSKPLLKLTSCVRWTTLINGSYKDCSHQAPILSWPMTVQTPKPDPAALEQLLAAISLTHNSNDLNLKWQVDI